HRVPHQVERGADRVPELCCRLLPRRQLRSQLGELASRLLEPPRAYLLGVGRCAGVVAEEGEAMAPVRPPLPCRPPGQGVPDKVGHLLALLVMEPHGPWIRDFTRLELRPHERVGRRVVCFYQVDHQLAAAVRSGRLRESPGEEPSGEEEKKPQRDSRPDNARLAAANSRQALDPWKGIPQILNHYLEKTRLFSSRHAADELFGFLELAHETLSYYGRRALSLNQRMVFVPSSAGDVARKGSVKPKTGSRAPGWMGSE